MKNGFTTKELLIAIFVIGITSFISIRIVNNNINNSEKKELINNANLYIKKLNNDILQATANNKDMIYNSYIPHNIGESMIFKIENTTLDTNNKYKGIIKATCIGENKYDYKIAIYDGKYMLGSKNNLLNKEELIIKHVKAYEGFQFDN